MISTQLTPVSMHDNLPSSNGQLLVNHQTLIKHKMKISPPPPPSHKKGINLKGQKTWCEGSMLHKLFIWVLECCG